MQSIDRGRIWIATVLALVIGACGLAPHIAFSLERHEVTWFYNSYDEGYYGWAALHEPILHRILAAAALRTLEFICGGSLQSAMIVADFLFPLLCVLAACFATAAVTRTPAGMAAAGLLLLTASEMLAFRSTYSPTQVIYPVVESVFRVLDPRPEGWFPMGNATGVFWLFRTPEPQITWIVILLTLGSLLRMVQARSGIAMYLVCCMVAGFGYLLVVVPFLGAVCFGGVAVALKDRWMGLRIFLPALAGGIISFTLAMISATGTGGSSFVFESRGPAILPSGILGLAVAGVTAVVGYRRGRFGVLSILAVAFGVAPLLMANQQILTGRMLYLFNFENFAFSLTVAMAAILSWAAIRDSRPAVAPLRWWASIPAGAGLLLLAVTVAVSQHRGYQHGLPVNRSLSAHVDAIKGSRLSPETSLVCDDIYMTDNLAIRLGWRPNYLLSRDMTFSHAIERLSGPGTVPREREFLQPRLFETLALTGMTPEEFSDALDAVSDPRNKNWKARFGIGAFLYSFADFWEPLTHGRSVRLAWIAAEKPSLVEAYKSFHAGDEWPSSSVVRIGKWSRPDWAEIRETFRTNELYATTVTRGRPVRAIEILERKPQTTP